MEYDHVTLLSNNKKRLKDVARHGCNSLSETVQSKIIYSVESTFQHLTCQLVPTSLLYK